MAIANIDLIGDSRPVVTPQATATMAQAVRDGTISILDIMDRVDARTRAKQELELITAQQGIADATNPDLIQAKRNQQLAAGAQAGSALALNPLAEQAKTAELKAAIFDAQARPGGFDLMQNALSKAGFPVSIDPNVGLTDANKSEITKRFAALQDYTIKRADAEDRVKSTETKFFPTEQKLPDGSSTKGQLQKLFRNGQEITSDEFKNWAVEAEALRRTPFSQWYALQGTKPGQVAAPIQPQPLVVQPNLTAEQANAQRAQLFNAGVPGAVSLTNEQLSTQSLIQPRAVASAPQIGQTAPGIGIVTSVEAAPAALRPTEGQQRALLAVPRFTEANKALADLQARNYDPTSWTSWVDSYLPQILKSGDRKEFETATSAWAQGLLRLESGAAITPKEESWYAKVFFPQVGDPAYVLKQKENLRHAAEGMVAEIGSAGPISEELKQRAQGVYQAAETFNTPRGVAAPASVSGETTAVVGGKTYVVRTDPTTGQKRYFVRQ